MTQYQAGDVYSDFNAARDDLNWMPEDLMMSVTNELFSSDIYVPSRDVDFDTPLGGEFGFQ
jgi:hypothetical protein